MKKSSILNKELNAVIASMGHTEYLIVCDAGFPIPSDVRRVDLALTRDVPDLKTVLSAIAEDFIAEKIYVAEDVPKSNAPLYHSIQEIYHGVEIETHPHSDILTTFAKEAKAIVRTGSFEPWGNIVLQSGVDVPKWFDKEGVIVPDYYKDKM
ncbi:ribose pyranase [Mesobacillus campisalis]|uniref:D-ribose pyranase n=1 Tax=Mesobacillus campisalis TaxID=1408103 RepID=A0A0M2T5E9_9BACI|nr:D-ribose pyranase [Mesobacillus campisalis]KKK40045.1 ribose pyranase [Mesobacillus campisalis]